jgi:CRISPR system Cascade subunit CasE
MDRKGYLLGEDNLPLSIENPSIKEMNLQLHEGQVLSFRLKANPTFKKTTIKENGDKHKSRLGIFEEDDQRKWLANKLNLAGAALVSVNILNRQFMHGKLFTEPQKEKRIPFLCVQFDGVLQVKNPGELVKTIYAGIGTSKGFGFGLLSLARVQ